MAASRELKVSIIGDSSSLQAALGKSTKATSTWGKRVQQAGRYAGFAGLAIGGALVAGLTKATKGAMEDETAMARLAQAFKQSDVPIAQYTKAIDKAEAAGVRLGFTDDAVIESLGSLVIATHDGKKAIDLLSTAEDIARFKHTDLASASKMLTMAMAGSQRAVKQLGLQVQPTTENVDALKAAAKANKTEVDAMALAHAKAADKQATAGQVIDMVTQKLKGQAAVFAETSAGGMEKMRASLDRLSDTIGAALLPALNKVIEPLSRFFAYLAENPKLAEGMVIGLASLAAALLALSVAASIATSIGTLTAALALLASPIALVVIGLVALTAAIAAAVLWPDKLQAALQRMGMSSKEAKQTVDALRNAFTAIKAVVNTVWPSIQATVVPALKVIQGMLMVVSALLRGDFSAAWKGIKQVIANELKFITALITAFPRIVLAGAVAIGRALLDGIGQGLRRLGPFMREKLQAIPSALADVAKKVPGWAAQIGRDIVSGILSGLGGLLGRLKDYLEGQIKGALSSLNPFSTVQQGAKKLIADEITKGATDIDVENQLKKKLEEQVKAAVEAVKTARGNFASAFSGLADVALQAFDAKMAQWVPPAQLRLDKMQIQQQLRDLNAAIVAAGGQIQAGFGTLSLTDKIKTLNAEMVAATKSGQTELAAALRAKLEFLLAQQAQVQQAAHDKQVAQDRLNFQKRLGNLQSELQKMTESGGELTAKESAKYRAKLANLLKDYGIDAKFWGTAIGISLADGLRQAQGAVRKAALALAREIQKLLKVKSPTEEGPMSDLDRWWSNLVPTLISGVDVSQVRAFGASLAGALAGGVQSRAWGRSFTSFASTATQALGDVGTAKDALSDNYTEFSAATEEMAETTGAAFQGLVSVAGTLGSVAARVFPSLTELLRDTNKNSASPLASIALGLNHLAAQIALVSTYLYGLRNAARDTLPEVWGLFKNKPVLPPSLFLSTNQTATLAGRSVPAPLAAMGGGSVVNVNIYGPAVGTGREFEDTVRRALYDVSRRNPGFGLSPV